MNISLNAYNYGSFIKEKVLQVLDDQNRRIIVIASLAFSFFIVGYLAIHNYFKAKVALDFKYQVVEANESDAEAIHKVVKEAYKRDFFRDPERERASLKAIQSYFQDREHTWYVIKVPRNNISEIACAVLYSTDNASETSIQGNIHMLAALPAYWGKKLSIPLLQTVENRALQDRKSKIRLMVANENRRLMRFYESQGYRLTNGKFEFPTTSSVQTQYRDKIYCLYMEKDLTKIHSK